MKTITCREMGGMCDEPITAESSEQMLTEGMKHLDIAHPEMAASVRSMPEDHPMMVKWNEEFMDTWEKTPETE